MIIMIYINYVQIKSYKYKQQYITYLVRLQFKHLLLDAWIHVKRFSLFMYRQKNVTASENYYGYYKTWCVLLW